MKTVLASIRPRHCRNIWLGRKTLEIRKNRPGTEEPFRCLIYCTKAEDDPQPARVDIAKGMVIGEFVCDWICQCSTFSIPGTNMSANMAAKLACLSMEELAEYERSRWRIGEEQLPVGLYGWHISHMKAYGEPVELERLGIERAPQSWRYVPEGLQG